MTPEYREKLKEEWLVEHEVLHDARPEHIADFWLSKIDTLLEEKVKEIRNLRVDYAVIGSASSYNAGLEAAEKVITNNK